MFSKKKFCAIIALALLCLACVFTASITTKNVSAEEQQIYPTEMKYDYLPCSLIRWESGFNKEISNRDIPITKRSMILTIKKGTATMGPYWKPNLYCFQIRKGNQISIKAEKGERVYGVLLYGKGSNSASSTSNGHQIGQTVLRATPNTGEVFHNGWNIGWTGNTDEVILTFDAVNQYQSWEFEKVCIWFSNENIETPEYPVAAGDVSALVEGFNTKSAKTVYFGESTTVQNDTVAPLTWKVVGYNGNGVASKPGTLTLMSDAALYMGQYKDRDNLDNYEATSDGRVYSDYGKSNINKQLTLIANSFSTDEKVAIYERTLFDSETPVYNAPLWIPSEEEVFYMDESIRSPQAFSTRTYTYGGSSKGCVVGYNKNGWQKYTVYYGNDHVFRAMVMIDLSKIESVTQGEDGIFTFNYKRPPHFHNWEYSLSEDKNVLTATCDQDYCPAPLQKLPIDVESKDFDGFAVNATLNTNNWQADTLYNVVEVKAEYVGINNTVYEKTTTAPVDAGDYKVSFTVGEYTLEKEFTISPIDVDLYSGSGSPSISVIELFRTLNVDSYGIQTFLGRAYAGLDNENLVYNGKEQQVVNTQIVEDEVNYKFGYLKVKGGRIVFSVDNMDGPWSMTPKLTEVGLYKLYWKLEASNGNFIGTEANAENFIYAIIEEIPCQITTAPTAKTNLVYNGNEQALITAGQAEGGTMLYKVGEDGTYSEEVPKATNAGEYNVYYKVVGDENYGDIAEEKITVTIGKLDVNVTAPTAKAELEYNGGEQALVTAGAVDGGTLLYKVGEDGTYSEEVPKVANAGEYKVYFKVAGGINYNDITEVVIIVIISKANVNVTAPTVKTNLEYNGGEQALVTAGSVNGGTLLYKLGEDGVYTEEVPKATNAGEYKVYYKVVGGENYNDVAEVVITVIIGKATVNVTAPTVKTNLEYNGGEQALVTAGSVNGGTLLYKLGENGTYSEEVPKVANAGEYGVYYKVVGGENYNDVVEVVIIVIISKANVNVTAPTAKTNLVYGGEAQALITAGAVSGGTMLYKLGENGTYSEEVPKATNAGEYKVYYKVVGGENYNDVAEVVITVIIGKATVNVTAPVAKELVYNNGEQSLVTVGEVNVGTLLYKLGEDGTYSEEVPQMTNAGEYKVYYKVIGNENYNDVAEVVITVIIGKANRASLPALTVQSFDDVSVTLNAIADIDGYQAEYGYSLTENGNFVYGQNNVFTQLNDATTYYFNYKIAESANYNEFVSATVAVTTNPTDRTKPQINGVEEDVNYCVAQTITIVEENLVSVVIDGVDVTENLVNGSIVLEVKSRPQIIVVSDIAGNTTKMIVNVIGHQGRWEIIQQPTVNQDGIQKNVCPECGETKEEVLPKITFDSNDKINCGGAMGGTTEVFIAVVAMAIIICKKFAKKAA